ncbi:MAG: invasion associated locus B family protein [Pseudomonadota bacterium]
MMRKFWLALLILTASSGAAGAAATDLQVGQAFGAWVFQCSAVGQDKTLCAFRTTVVSADTKQIVVDLRIARPDPKADYIMSAILPLGLNIQAGVKTAVDGVDSTDLLLRACFAKGCIATADLAEATVQSLTSGKDLSLKFDMSGKTITATMKLEGLNDALAAAKW